MTLSNKTIALLIVALLAFLYFLHKYIKRLKRERIKAKLAMEIHKLDSKLEGINAEIDSKSLDELIVINNALSAKSKSRKK